MWRYRPDPAHPTGRDAVHAILSYVLCIVDIEPERLRTVLATVVDPDTARAMTSTAEQIANRARTEGIAMGRAEGRAETVLRLLQKRFGPLSDEVERRVRNSTRADLDCWTDRVLDAQTLGAVCGTI